MNMISKIMVFSQHQTQRLRFIHIKDILSLALPKLSESSIYQLTYQYQKIKQHNF